MRPSGRLDEADYTRRAAEALRAVRWASPLLARFEERGGVAARNTSIMFEIRFAYELHLAGVAAEYEHAARAGDSSVDFRIHTPREWLVELVSIEKSYATNQATRCSGQRFGTVLTTGSPA